MQTLKLTTKQIEKIFFDDSYRFFVVEREEWEDQGKYQTCCFIFRDINENINYRAYVGRSGSHWNGYDYDSEYNNQTEELHPVEHVPVTVMQWKNIDGKRIMGSVDMTREVNI